MSNPFDQFAVDFQAAMPGAGGAGTNAPPPTASDPAAPAPFDSGNPFAAPMPAPSPQEPPKPVMNAPPQHYGAPPSYGGGYGGQPGFGAGAPAPPQPPMAGMNQPPTGATQPPMNMNQPPSMGMMNQPPSGMNQPFTGQPPMGMNQPPAGQPPTPGNQANPFGGAPSTNPNPPFGGPPSGAPDGSSFPGAPPNPGALVPTQSSSSGYGLGPGAAPGGPPGPPAGQFGSYPMSSPPPPQQPGAAPTNEFFGSYEMPPGPISASQRRASDSSADVSYGNPKPGFPAPAPGAFPPGSSQSVDTFGYGAPAPAQAMPPVPGGPPGGSSAPYNDPWGAPQPGPTGFGASPPPADPSAGALVAAAPSAPNQYGLPFQQPPSGQQPQPYQQDFSFQQGAQPNQLQPAPAPPAYDANDPFSVFNSPPAPAPAPATADAGALVTQQAAPAAAGDPWLDMGFDAPPSSTPAPAISEPPRNDGPLGGAPEPSSDEKKEEGLPPNGDTYDARIFTPTLGVMFFKPQELTDSLFLNTDRSIVDGLAERPVVAFIVEGSSARSAGVELGHVLLKVNGVDVKNPKDASRLIKEGPRPLPLVFYVPNTDVVVAEGEHMVKYDTRETTAPNSAKDWKPKYVVIGGIIAQPWMMNMYRSKSEYDIAVIETQARRPVSVKVKQFSLNGARIQNDWQGPQMIKYKNKLHPWKFIVVLPVARNPIKISAPSLSQLKPVHEGIRRVLLAQQRDRGSGNPHTAAPVRNSDPYSRPHNGQEEYGRNDPYNRGGQSGYSQQQHGYAQQQHAYGGGGRY